MSFEQSVDTHTLLAKPWKWICTHLLRPLRAKAWVAERLAALSDFFVSHASDMHEVVRTIVDGGRRYSAADLFSGQTQIETLKKRVTPTLAAVDVLVVPTVPTVYTRAQVLAEPYHTNRNLGYYTNFVNLLDLAALAVPTCMRADGLPAGVTLLQQSGSDLMLADLGTRLHAATGLTLGATGQLLPQGNRSGLRGDTVEVAVVGAHLSGQPLNHQLLERAGRLLQTCRTAPHYHLYAYPTSTPPNLAWCVTPRVQAMLSKWRCGGCLCGITAVLWR